METNEEQQIDANQANSNLDFIIEQQQQQKDQQKYDIEANQDCIQTNLITNDGKIKLQIKEIIQKQDINQQSGSNEHSESDSNGSENLPPPNPILLNNQADDLVKTAYKFVFNKLPMFNESTQNGKHLIQTTPQNLKFATKKADLLSTKKDKLAKDGTLQDIYGNMEPIYKKMDNSNFNFVPLVKKRYFSGLFCDLKKLVNDEKGDALTTQYDFINYVQRNSRVQIQLDSDKNQVNESPSINAEPLNKIKYKHTLRMDSSFESGNLFAGYQVGAKEYDLILQNDTNSKGNTQWFFFSVSNTQKNQIVRFNIVNLMKNDSLFNFGMRPVVFSKKKNEQEQQGWFRGGFNISYFKNPIQRESQDKKTYFTLQFSYKFENTNDTVYFAHCYPYTYSNLNTYLNGLMQSNPQEMSKICQRKKLCLTLARNKCEALTITAPKKIKPSPNQKNKQVVIIMARQHPGETPGSWMVEGVINYLCNLKSEEAQYLRERCVFKVIPMVNPDGVIHGNYRTDLSGVDLNRNWQNPSKEYLTTIYAIKQLINSISKEYKIRYIIDLHGHSKKMNAFFYGNPNEEDVEESRIFPLVCADECRFIDFQSCTFKLQQSKANTARIALYNQLFKTYKTNILTLEASFYGSVQKNQEKNHFTIDQFKEIGAAVCKSIYKLYKQEEEYELEMQKMIEQQKQDSLDNPDNPQLQDKRQVVDVQIYKSMNVYERLFRNFKCDVQSVLKKSIIKDQTKSKDESSGSDSDPSADELSVKEIKSINENITKVSKTPTQIIMSSNNGGNTNTSKQSHQNRQYQSCLTKSENTSPTTFKSALKPKIFEEDEIRVRRNLNTSISAQNMSIAIQTDYQDWLQREKSLTIFSTRIQDDEESIDIIDIKDYPRNGLISQGISNTTRNTSQQSSFSQSQSQNRGNIAQGCLKNELKTFQEFISNTSQFRQGGAKSELPQYRKNSYWQQTYNSKAQKITILNQEINSSQQSQSGLNQSNDFKLPSAINSTNAKSISTSPMKNIENQSQFYYGSNQAQNANNQTDVSLKIEDQQSTTVSNSNNNPQLQQSQLYKTIFKSPKEENPNFLIQLSKNTYKLTKQGYINYNNHLITLKKNEVGPQATQLQFSVREQKKQKAGTINRLQSRQNQLSSSFIETIPRQNAKGQNIIVHDASTQTLITIQSISKFCKTSPSRNSPSPIRLERRDMINPTKGLDESFIIKQFNSNVNSQLRSALSKNDNYEKQKILKNKRSGSQELIIDHKDNNSQERLLEQKSSFDDLNILADDIRNNQILLSNPSMNRGSKQKKKKNNQQRMINMSNKFNSKTQQVSPDDRMNLLVSDLQPLNIQLNKNLTNSNFLSNYPSSNNQPIQQNNENYGNLSNRKTGKTTNIVAPLNSLLPHHSNVSVQCHSQSALTNALGQNGQSMLTGGVNNKNVTTNNMVSLLNNESQLNNKQNLTNNVILNKAKLIQIINTQFQQNNSTRNQNAEINIQGVNLKAIPNQSINLQAIGVISNNIQTVNQKVQLLPIDVESSQKEHRNSSQQNKFNPNNNEGINSFNTQVIIGMQNKESLNNKINRVSKNGRSISGQKGYGDSQLQQSLINTTSFTISNNGSNQNSIINNQVEYYKYDLSQNKDISRRTSAQNKINRDLLELSQTFQNDSQVKITQSEKKNKLNKLLQTHNSSFDSYNVPSSQQNLNYTQYYNQNNNLQSDQIQGSALEINQQFNSSQNCNPQSDSINLENQIGKYKTNKEVIDIIKQQRANKIQTFSTTTSNINNSSGANQSMKIAFVQRQSRKVYNSPFNQRFLEKILN